MIELPWLAPDDLSFPPVHTALAEPDGLLAGGGDLRAERLIRAYCQGIFPWYEHGQPILWWSPNPRTVMAPTEVHIARSMRKVLKKHNFQVTCNRAFDTVMRACAAPRGSESGTWITDDMLAAYSQLNALGAAHSVEVWHDKALVGGLYGVALGRVFFGESMFSRSANASKVGFITLATHLDHWGFELIDCQVASEHLFSLGAREMPRDEFVAALAQLTTTPNRQISPWPNTIDALEYPPSLRDDKPA